MKVFMKYIIGSSLSELVSLGTQITNEEMVGKFLRCLPRAWEPKIMTIEETKNIKTLDFDKFIGSLIAHEGKIKKLKMKGSGIKKRSLALKFMNDNEVKKMNIMVKKMMIR